LLNRNITGRNRRRKNIAGILYNTARHLQNVANINADILEIEEGTRLVSLVSLLQKLSAEMDQNTTAMEDK